jgi:hypothetical protein
MIRKLLALALAAVMVAPAKQNTRSLKEQALLLPKRLHS